jgi:hypothetical protein
MVQVAPAAVNDSLSFSASSFERSAFTIVGQDSTNFFAWSGCVLIKHYFFSSPRTLQTALVRSQGILTEGDESA